MNQSMVILGNSGFLGKHVEKLAQADGWKILGLSRSRGFDLRVSGNLEKHLGDFEPSLIVNCAAHVGGLSYSRDKQASLLADNTRMSLALLDFMAKNPKVRLVNPIANCAYPGELASFGAEDFWDGPVHPSVLGYGGARRLAVLASEVYRDQFGVTVVDVALPNLYGTGDHLSPTRAHALGGLVVKTLLAIDDGSEEVSVWGSGSPIREWLYVEDAARSLLLASVAENPPEFFNVGSGEGISISKLAHLIARLAGFTGRIVFDSDFPDGAAEKRMEVDPVQLELLGWNPTVSLEDGVARTIKDFRERLRPPGQPGRG